MIKNVIFICGLGGDAGMTYVSELEKFCKDKNWNFYAPSMPSYADGITYDKYKTSFENLINSNFLNLKQTLIIAQSAGTNFFVKYMAENTLEIGGYISVSGFSKHADKIISDETKGKLKILDDFFPTLKNYESFKQLPFEKYSIFGGKDCFFTTLNLKNYAELIGAKEYFDENGLHCTISENVTKHELLHKVIDENFN